MGSPEGRDDERPIHRVAIGPFSIGTTPVTNLEYAPFLASGGGEPPPWWSDPAFSLPRQPVVGVSWEDASRFAAWLAESAGGTWRLPTEAEWEFAAFGGLDSGAMPPGEDLPPPEVPDGPLSGPWEVGRGAANGYGLFDMGTIVHEWCLDWYAADYYAVSPAAGPRGPASGLRRSSRGGSWRHAIRWSSPCARSSLPPGRRYSDYGFRVLREA